MAVADIFRRVLTAGGLKPHVVDAAIANFIWESGGRTDINTANQSGDGGRSWGAGQWNGERRTNLMNFAQRRGTDWTDPETQALFVLHELSTSEAPAFRALNATSTPEEALAAWTHRYERAGTPHMEGRLAVLHGGIPTSQTPSYSRTPGSAGGRALPPASDVPPVGAARAGIPVGSGTNKQANFDDRAAEAQRRIDEINALLNRPPPVFEPLTPPVDPRSSPAVQRAIEAAGAMTPVVPPYVNPGLPGQPTHANPHIPGQDPRSLPSIPPVMGTRGYSIGNPPGQFEMLPSYMPWQSPTPSWVRGPDYGLNPAGLPPMLRR